MATERAMTSWRQFARTPARRSEQKSRSNFSLSLGSRPSPLLVDTKQNSSLHRADSECECDHTTTKTSTCNPNKISSRAK